MRDFGGRPPQVGVLGSAEAGSRAFELAGEAGALIARLGYTLVSGCGSAATRVAAERALAAGGQVLSIVPHDDPDPPDERERSPILPWTSAASLETRFAALGFPETG